MLYPYRAAPEGCWNAPKANHTRAEPVWTHSTVDHFPMWSRVCQSKSYRPCHNECLNTNPKRAALVCNASHPEVGCKVYWKGTTVVRFPEERLNAHKVNHPGSARHSTAWYGLLQKVLEHGILWIYDNLTVNFMNSFKYMYYSPEECFVISLHSGPRHNFYWK